MKVLFAVDGSEGASAAVRQVGQLLSADRDRVGLYFALPEVIVRHASSSEEMAERARRAIADAAFEPARALLPDALAASAELLTDKHLARDGILRAADAWVADLIVVGARGLGGLDQMLLGSVSQSLVHCSQRPMLVVRPNPEHRPNGPLRVLYTYDGSASSTAALQMAEKLTMPTGTQLTAVAVVEPLQIAELPPWMMKKARDADSEAMAAAWQREHEDEVRQARDQLTAFMAKQPTPFNAAESLVVEGNAAEQILKLVHDRHIDLIIIGTHGSGMLERLLMGSTSDKVLNHAPCSVLLSRG